MCERCQAIRQHAAMLAQFGLGPFSNNDALHCVAVMYALAKRNAIDNNVSEEGFNNFWNELTTEELQNINELNPMEPKTFDEGYDFRTQLHK